MIDTRPTHWSRLTRRTVHVEAAVLPRMLIQQYLEFLHRVLPAMSRMMEAAMLEWLALAVLWVLGGSVGGGISADGGAVGGLAAPQGTPADSIGATLKATLGVLQDDASSEGAPGSAQD